MCGIGGILRVHPPGGEPPPPAVAIPEAWLDVLDESIKHRGPDGQGRFRDRVVRADGCTVDVALVHRRLSIIDHAGGAQPMVSPGRSSPVATSAPLGLVFHGGPRDEGRYQPIDDARHDLVAVVFNGCIYNHRELRAELQHRGHEFTSDHSDTEVLIHGWREWREELPAHLDGMHAFAIWDAARAQLFAAVDRAGEKPLFISERAEGDFFAFSSTAAGQAQLNAANRGASAELHPFGFNDLLQFGFLTDAAYTPVRDAQRLRSAHSIIVNTTPAGPKGRQKSFRPASSEQRQRDGWRPSGKPPALNADRLDQLLDRAVRSRLEADVPAGCLLSGGIDSSLVAFYAARAAGSLRTFTVRMPHPEYDESRHAERAAAAIGTTHFTLECHAEPASDLVKLIPELGWPLGDSSLLPTSWACRAAREHVGVVLTGDGGDELFAGYDRYLAARWLREHGPLLSAVPGGAFPSRNPRSRLTRAGRLAHAASDMGYPSLLGIFDNQTFTQLTGRRGRKPWASGSGDAAAEAMWFDWINYLPGDLMAKVDTASMHVALESRAPFFHRELIDSAMNTPMEVLLPGGERKGLLKQVARKYLPAEIVDRPKMGFAIPVGEWFRTDYGGMRQLLLDHLDGPEPFGPDSLGINPMINMAFVRQMLREHDDAGRASLWPWKGRDHSQRLYMLLVLSIWARWLGGLK